ncbi:MAG: hypothetical protein U0Q18_01925 [Bryobacteraceae bacterium]
MIAYAASLLISLYLLACIATLRTGIPWCDEGWFGEPAYTLNTRGMIANPTIDPTYTLRTLRFTGVDRHMYYAMPGYILAQAVWYRITGFGLFAMRSLSVMWSIVALLAWGLILDWLFDDPIMVLAAIGAVALDFHFIWAATAGRMDMMTAALGLAAIAVYLRGPARYAGWTVFGSHCLMAAAIFTHPYAVLLWIDLVALTLFFDGRKLNIRTIASAVTPYFACIAAWAVYIGKDPGAFRAQFGGNAAARWDGLLIVKAPWTELWNEIHTRYLEYYGLAPYSHGISRAKLAILVIYFASFGAMLATRKIRQRQAYRVLLWIAGAHCLLLTAFDGMKLYTYLLYVVPFLASLAALYFVFSWRARSIPRALLLVAGAVFVTVQLATVWTRVLHNDYANRYLPAARFLQSHLQPAQTVMATAEFGFQLGFGGRLIDDYRLGCLSGKRPDFVVIEERAYVGAIGFLKTQDPPCYRFVQNELSRHFRRVYDSGGYRIYERQPDRTALPPALAPGKDRI